MQEKRFRKTDTPPFSKDAISYTSKDMLINPNVKTSFEVIDEPDHIQKREIPIEVQALPLSVQAR
jgi:hypothetical protein